MKRQENSMVGRPLRLDEPEFLEDLACQNERANWIASRIGLPTVGSMMVNQHGIEWVVQSHATVPTTYSLQRWRNGDIQPDSDMYPVVAPQNFSPKLTEFIDAVDRCTTKTFAMLDTMPGRRMDGHVPGGNMIDTAADPITNILFIDAQRVHESVIAHEFGHAWVQYVDECEDLRTIKDASNPQRMRQVSQVQSFVLDLKVNDLIRRKGFDMRPIEEHQVASLHQLAMALQLGYRPEYPRERVFMSLLVADQMLQREGGHHPAIERYDSSLKSIRQHHPPIIDLAEKMADSVKRHGYDSQSAVVACVDECLLASFEHCGDRLDLDGELIHLIPEEPNLNKFPDWLPILPPKVKCRVGRHMAKNEISVEWVQSAVPTLTERTRVTFRAPDGRRSELIIPHRIGPPTPYFGMPEEWAQNLEHKRQCQAKQRQLLGDSVPIYGDPHEVMEFNERNRQRAAGVGPLPPPPFPAAPPKPPGRTYTAGEGCFITAARLAEQLQGEQPYVYAFANPTTYTDPSGLLAKLFTQVVDSSPNTGICQSNHPYVTAEWGLTGLTHATQTGFIVQLVELTITTSSCSGANVKNYHDRYFEAWQVAAPQVYQGYEPNNPPGEDPFTAKASERVHTVIQASTTAYYFSPLSISWPDCAGPDGPLPCLHEVTGFPSFWSHPASNALKRTFHGDFNCCEAKGNKWTMTYNNG